jgi:hypothetical protein
MNRGIHQHHINNTAGCWLSTIQDCILTWNRDSQNPNLIKHRALTRWQRFRFYHPSDNKGYKPSIPTGIMVSRKGYRSWSRLTRVNKVIAKQITNDKAYE